MREEQINRIAIKRIAHALGELNQRAVFVGGAVVALYTDDKTAEDVRETKDVDISIEITGLGDLESIREKLTEKGFTQSAEDNVICRFRYDDIKVDVMSTKDVGWSPANRWFEPGFKYLQTVNVEGIMIRILPLSFFLASKFEAFNNRSGKDPRTSHDFEDIVYLLDHTSNIKNQLLETEQNVREYLKGELTKIQNNDILQEAVLANLASEYQNTRYTKIMNLLKEITHDIY